MSDQNQDKHLDELLDSMLSEYSSVEPGPGLETRVLARVREAEGREAPAWRNWKWLWAGVAAAGAVLLLGMWMGRLRPGTRPSNRVVRIHQPAPDAPQKQQSAAVASPAQQKAPAAQTGARRHPQAGRKQTPLRNAALENAALAWKQRPAIFPTPTPLSEQEQLLLRYMERTPREEMVAQSHAEEPPIAATDQSDIGVPDLVLVPQKPSNTR
jgi:hypothetical protein